MTSIFRSIGLALLSRFRYLAQLVFLAMEVITSPFKGRIRFNLIGQQLVRIGFGSQLVVIVTGAFTGAVFAAQSYYKFSDFGVETAVGSVVSIAMCRELGPVLTGIMVTARVGAAMAAEIGTMKVTDQINALRSFGIHPVDYLVFPRMIGMVISIPLLIAESVGFGILASWLVITQGFKVPSAWYVHHLKQFTTLEDIYIGMIKGFVFGIIIVLVCCHKGLTVENGAVGVGKNTTDGVVIAALGILVVNFFLSIFLNFFFPLSVS